MATIPLWALGKHVTSILLTPQTVNATTGVLSDTTPTRQFFGHLDEITVDGAFTMENISSMDRPYENNVPIEFGGRINFHEFEKSAGTNLAAAAAFSASYWKYTIVRGAQSFVGWGVLEKYEMTANKQRVMANLSLAPIDTGTDVMTYA
jgi:hypothetical protein